VSVSSSLKADSQRSQVWALTNAYSTHAKRVLGILGVDDLIEGVFFCDYAQENFYCKPEAEFYQQALQAAGVTDPSKCLFVDDNLNNVKAAKKLGWASSVWYREEESFNAGSPNVEGVDHVIADIEELRACWKDVFKL